MFVEKTRSYKAFSCKKRPFYLERKYFKRESEGSCMKCSSLCKPYLNEYIFARVEDQYISVSQGREKMYLCVKHICGCN